MNKFFKGMTYAFHRNIGWQDRTIRSVVGLFSLLAAIYFYPASLGLSIAFAALAMAQAWTVFSARCIICYFAGVCTIRSTERNKLKHSGIQYEG